MLVWLPWGEDSGRRKYERHSDKMAKIEALIQVLIQSRSLQPWVVAVTVASKKVRSLLVLGDEAWGWASISSPLSQEICKGNWGVTVHKGQAENSGFIMLDEPHETADMMVYDIHE